MKIKAKIKIEVKDNFFNLMADIASKNGRSILGVCLQFVNDGKIYTRCIGMVQIKKRHTSVNLKEILLELLADYGIDCRRITTFTIDNGSNMKKLVRLFSDDIRGELEQLEELDEINNETIGTENPASSIENSVSASENEYGYNFTNNEIENLIQEYDNEDTDELDAILNGDADNSSFDESVEELEAAMANFAINVNRVPCSAHTLQLAVLEALEPFKLIIDLCRTCAKMLRRQVYVYDLLSAGIRIKVIRLDSKVRWGSGLRMVRIHRIYL